MKKVEPSKLKWWEYIVAYKPNDTRIIVEKNFGVGVTLNLSTFGGKFILFLFIIVPIIIILIKEF